MNVRLAIARVDPKSVNIVEFCALHGLSTSSFYRLRKRFREEGEAGLQPRSRAPKRVANRTPAAVEDRVVQLRKDLDDLGVDAGPGTIWAHLRRELPRDRLPSEATIWRILTARGLITPQPRKGGRRRWKRFAAERANECWQADSTHWTLGDGTEVEIINIIDDCSRLAVVSKAVSTTTTTNLWDAVVEAASRWGWPERFLRDNGPPYKAIAVQLHAMGIHGIHSRPYHPQTCGKVERFHQTLKRYLTTHGPFATLDALQVTLDTFIDYYNHTRPHRALQRATPASVWHATPKSGPLHLPAGTPTTILRGKVHGGRVVLGNHRYSVGAHHNGTPVIAIITGTHCHITTHDGTVIRSHHINPDRYDQPLHHRPGRPTT